jgi:hypothetical protein
MSDAERDVRSGRVAAGRCLPYLPSHFGAREPAMMVTGAESINAGRPVALDAKKILGRTDRVSSPTRFEIAQLA